MIKIRIKYEPDWENNPPIKNLFEFDVPTSKNKKLNIQFYIITNKTESIKCLKCTVWHLHKLVDYKGYEDEWGSSDWKHYEIFRWNKKL